MRRFWYGWLFFVTTNVQDDIAQCRGARYSDPSNSEETWLVNTVQRQAELAGIGMPEVAVYDSPEINAFATEQIGIMLGGSEYRTAKSMSRDEAEAVLAHEVSHVANGDMVTLTLIQGVLNTFVYFFARIVANMVNRETTQLLLTS